MATTNFKSPTDAAGRAGRYLSTLGTEAAWAGVILSAIGSNCAVSANNSGLFIKFTPKYDLVCPSFLWVVGSQSGNYDVGLYDADGNRLWAKGSTTVPSTGTTVTETFTGIQLTAGQDYYVGWSSDNTTAGVKGLAISGLGELAKMADGVTLSTYSVASVFPLPSTVTYGSTSVNRLPFFVLRGT